MQVHPVEVWDLLHLLGLPPEWSADAFLRFFEDLEQPSPSSQALDRMAGLFRAVERSWGEVATEDAQRLTALSRFKANKVLRALRDPASIPRRQLETEERRAALRIVQAHTPIRRLVSRHTRALLRRYFKAGTLTTPIAERSVDDRFIDMSGEERALYDAVEEYIASTWNQAGAAERTAVGFVMTIYRRRLASSFHALRATLRKHLDAIAEEGRGRPAGPGPQSDGRDADAIGIAGDDRGRLAGRDRASLGAARPDGRGRPARSGSEDDRGRLAGSDEDAPDDETMDEMPDADEIAALERRALAAEEAQDVERLLDGIGRLPPDSKLDCLKQVLGELTVETDVYRALRSRIGLFESVVGRLQPILAQLPRTIAGAVVSGAGRERLERAGVTDAIERQAREAEAGGFDLDAALDADLTLPDRPPSPVTLDDLDRVIRSPDLMPPGTDVRPLAPREYGLLAPGMRERLRVTTDPAWYEEHAESVELWSPGNPLFRAPELLTATEEMPEKKVLADFLER